MLKVSESNLDHASVVTPARELRKLHASGAFWKMVTVIVAAGVLLGVCAAMSLLTGGVLTRLMPELLAYILGALLHVAIGVSMHLVVHGSLRHDRREKTAGIVGLVFGLGALLYVFFVRAINWVEEGRSPLFAWGMSAFLLLVEIVVPSLFGYLLAKAWMAWEDAAADARYFRHHARLIETSDSPIRRWHDAEARLAAEIRKRQQALPTAKPEEQLALQSEIARLEHRLNTLSEWNPSRDFQGTPIAAPGMEPNPAHVNGRSAPSALPALPSFARGHPGETGGGFQD